MPAAPPPPRPDGHGAWVGEKQQKLLSRLPKRFGSAVSCAQWQPKGNALDRQLGRSTTEPRLRRRAGMGVRRNAWYGFSVLRRRPSAAARASCQLMFIFPRRTGPDDQPLSRFSAVRFELAILLTGPR